MDERFFPKRRGYSIYRKHIGIKQEKSGSERDVRPNGAPAKPPKKSDL